MKSLRIFLLVAATLLAVTQAVNGLSYCSDIQKELAAKKIHVFLKATLDGRGVRGVAGAYCLDDTFNVHVIYYCKEGYAALLRPNYANALVRKNFSAIVDLEQLGAELNTSILLVCIKIPPPPAPQPPLLSACPSGPSRMNQYVYRHRERLTAYRCPVRVAAHGASIGTRERTVYWCQQQYGDPVIVSRASRIYRCGPL